MKVTGIDILGLRYDREEACHEGYVALEIKPAFAGATPVLAQYLCHSGQSESTPPSIVTHDLIKDALRQAHRMPGFRRGEHAIEVEVSEANVVSHSASA